MKIHLRLLTSIAIFTFTLFSFVSADAKTTLECPVVYRELFEHSEKAMAALERETTFFYWGRARAAIEATPNDALDRIFGGMTKQDFEEFYWGVKSGEIKASAKEEKMIDELWHMVDDLGEKPFFGNVPDRGFAIREALQAHDKKLGYSGDPNFAAQLTDTALGKTEVEVLMRAVAEHDKNVKYPNSKWYDRIVRFFSPHYDKVKDILAADNSIRRQLQTMYTADQPALEALPKYTKDLSLSTSEVKELQNQVSDTASQLNGARAMIKELYGKEIAANNPLPQSEVRIRELAKRAKVSGAAQKEGELTTTIEGDMDTIDRVIGGAWDRTKGTKTGMPVTEKHDVHLQIRNPQYRRETPERRASYLHTTEPRSPAKSEYNVETEWTVTVQHAEPKTRQVTKTRTNSKGETESYTETEHYTDYYSTSYDMSRTDTLRARYEEVLNGAVRPSDHISDLPSLPSAQTRGAYAVSASNGSPSIGSYRREQTDWIMTQANKARGSETPYRAQIANVTEMVDGITNESYKAALKKPGETGKLVSALDLQEKALRENRSKLANYQGTDSGSIRSQWAYDQEKDFKDRNQQMVVRYDHMINRIVHLKEQIRRQTPSLSIETTVPSYEPQLAHLKAIKDKNRKIIVNTSVGAATTGAAATAYTYREEIAQKFREWTSDDDRRSRGY
ncbi:hypothetical protein BH10BDE1_BH10BDE1_12650 [soil metagenome]